MARTTTFVQEERVAVLKQITAERTATVHDVREALDQQRQALAQDGERITLAAVDRTFLRAAQLCAAVLVAVFLGSVLLILLAKRAFASPRGAVTSQRPPRPLRSQATDLGGEGTPAAT